MRWRRQKKKDARFCKPRFWSARLHRKFFLWMAISIALSFATAFLLLLVTRIGEPRYATVERVESFLAQRFGGLMSNETELRRLARDTAELTGAQLTLVRLDGSIAAESGGRCAAPRRVPVFDPSGQRVGRMDWCGHAAPLAIRIRLALGLMGALLALWMAAGFIASRFGRVLGELRSVAEDFGNGKLDRRLGSRFVEGYGELSDLARTLNEMAARIEAQIRDQRELLAMVSHELRTPLGHARILVDLIGEGHSHRLGELESELKEIDELVGELLASSRLQFGGLEPKRIDLVQLIVDEAERLSVDLPPMPTHSLYVHADPTLLRRAVSNLLRNAFDHAKGVDSVAVGEDEQNVWLEICDAGPGLAKGTEEEIFQPFFRQQNRAGASHPNLGIGLSLVRSIMQAHGGTAKADSRWENGVALGARFRLVFPKEPPKQDS